MSALLTPELDDEGYPTEETLRVVREWTFRNFSDFDRLLEYVQRAWRYPVYFQRAKRRFRPFPSHSLHRQWHVSTGGWSGNEDLIGALQDNRMFWLTCWVQSQRGGHYIFETREDDPNRRNE